MNNAASKPSPSPEEGRKPYRRPTVKSYGNVHEITAGVGFDGVKDAVSGEPPNKTQP